jgi:pyruvate/2-oxoglutarate/acetoin dehydrogenase E1 component
LVERRILRESDAAEIEQKMHGRLRMLAEKAASAKDPDVRDILWGVYAEPGEQPQLISSMVSRTLKKTRKYTRDSEGRMLYRHAVAEAITEEMVRDGRVILFGEDVADYGGGYKVTVGLLDTFGRERVFNTPISESAIVGFGMGAAIFGLRPISEIMYFDFILQAMDQLANQVAKTRYMYGGQVAVPLVIRTSIGQAKGYAGQHSQNLETLITNVPGIKIAVPSNAYDAKGLLKTAVRDDNPVLFIEHQSLYLHKDTVPADEEYTVPFGRARVVREGEAATIVSYSYLLHRALEAAAEFEKRHGKNVEVIDLRTLVPLDLDTVVESVSRTGRCMIVNQAPHFGNFAGFLSHEIQLRLFGRLKAPVMVVSAYDIPPPASTVLESENIPSVGRILEGLERLSKYPESRAAQKQEETHWKPIKEQA